MNAMKTVCMTLAALVLIGGTGAEETKRAETKPAVAVKEEFHVYGAWRRCGKPLMGTYQSIDEACRAAEKIRKDKQEGDAEVALNTRGQYGVSIHPIEYRVYRNPCKGFFLMDTVASPEKAKEIAEGFKKHGDRVEIVSVFAKK